jgi:murein DD-endopeptidase MepM/ murein hydrolase activator NlpD
MNRRAIWRGTLGALLAGALLAASSGIAGAGNGPGGLGFTIKGATVSPKHTLFDGKRKITLHYAFSARRSTDLTVSVVRVRSGNTERTWTERGAKPGERLERRWDGLNRRGKAVPDGRYEFRVGPSGAGGRYAAGLVLHGHVFPVDGPHGNRGAVGEFHAPRNGGRTHEGFDITGDCGTPLIAARGGTVQKTGYDPTLYGNYVLIDGAKTSQDYFYAHMVDPAEVDEGQHVYTGQEVGHIGQTGNAAGTPCHLHFEIHVHGEPVDPEPALKRWDKYS